jgi:hypothetical protein
MPAKFAVRAEVSTGTHAPPAASGGAALVRALAIVPQAPQPMRALHDSGSIMPRQRAG